MAHKILNCVNALRRAASISTEERIEEEVEFDLCQCPASGCIHFYSDVTKYYSFNDKRVNALSRATSISTSSTRILKKLSRWVSMP